MTVPAKPGLVPSMARKWGPPVTDIPRRRNGNPPVPAPSRDRPAGMPGRLADFEVARKLNTPGV